MFIFRLLLSKKQIIACTIILLVLVGCKQEKFGIGDGGVISGDPCSPPCFWNVYPGITTTDEAMIVLQDLKLSDNCNLFDNSEESGSRGIACSPYVIIIFQEDEDVVSSVGFNPTLDFSVGDVIDEFGNPDAVLVVSQGLPESKQTLSMTIFYDSWNMSFTLPSQVSHNYDLDLELYIENVSYSDESTYNAIRQYASKWQGFGIYKPRNE